MMGVPPDQAGRLTYWQFTAMREIWNDRHRDPNADDGEPVDAPDEAYIRERQAELVELGITGSA